MNVEWTPTSIANRQHQLEYLAGKNPVAALEVGDLIQNAVQRLAEFPASGRPGRVPGSRELVIVGTPYLIVYRIRPTQVIIVRLLHGAQRWSPGVAK